MVGHVWPDGLGLLDQPNLLVEAWSTIGSSLELATQGKEM